MLQEEASDLADLVALVRRLRAPDGCPWDRKQTLGSVRAYLVEEAHELAAAIDGGDPREVREELGDLLFQAAFIGCLAEEEGSFEIAEAVQGIRDKMVERHPHVFPQEAGPPQAGPPQAGPPQAGPPADSPQSVEEVVAAWEARKAAERGDVSVLAGLPRSLPALTAAYRLTQKAAGVGFDWPDVQGVLAKVKEELAEVEEALEVRRRALGQRTSRQEVAEVAEGAEAAENERLDEAVREELGDLLFAVANLARHAGMDPEAALAQGNLKFRRRFGSLEQVFRERGTALPDAGLEAMDEVWEAVKSRE